MPYDGPVDATIAIISKAQQGSQATIQLVVAGWAATQDTVINGHGARQSPLQHSSQYAAGARQQGASAVAAGGAKWLGALWRPCRLALLKMRMAPRRGHCRLLRKTGMGAWPCKCPASASCGCPWPWLR